MDPIKVNTDPRIVQLWALFRVAVIAFAVFALGRGWLAKDTFAMLGTIGAAAWAFVAGQLHTGRSANQLANLAVDPGVPQVLPRAARLPLPFLLPVAAGLAARLALVPTWVRQLLALLAAAALAAAVCAAWLHRHDHQVVATHEAAVATKVEATAGAAAQSAHHVVTTETTETEKSNADARAAAAVSDDPLAAGLDRLRTANPGPPRSGPR